MTNSLWIAVLAILILYLAARWVRGRTATEQEQSEQVRLLIRSSNAGVRQQLGAASELVVSRYYFRNTEIETGPADPADFYDELFVDLKATGSTQNWQNSIHVATPRGLDRVMAEEGWDSVIGTELLIVRKYDLQTILHAAVEHLQEIYEVQVQLTGGRGTSPDASV